MCWFSARRSAEFINHRIKYSFFVILLNNFWDLKEKTTQKEYTAVRDSTYKHLTANSSDIFGSAANICKQLLGGLSSVVIICIGYLYGICVCANDSLLTNIKLFVTEICIFPRNNFAESRNFHQTIHTQKSRCMKLAKIVSPFQIVSTWTLT